MTCSSVIILWTSIVLFWPFYVFDCAYMNFRNIMMQLLKTKKTEKVSQSVRPAWEDDKDVVATSKVNTYYF